MNRYHQKHRIVFIFCIITNISIMLLSSGEAKVLFVSPTGDGSNGESWQSAFVKIGDAIESSKNGDSIWIRYGTYEESIQVATTVEILGGFSGVETIDDITSRNPNIHHTEVTSRKKSLAGIGCGFDCIIDGLIVENCDRPGIAVFNGVTPTIHNCTIKNNISPTAGGGFLITASDPEICNCTITGNSAFSGGGLYIRDSSNVVLRNCSISFNSATAEGAMGGGIDFLGSSLVVDNCKIVGNSANGGSEFEAEGGGIFSNGGDVFVQNTFFWGNIASFGSGWQIYDLNSHSFFAQNCTIIGGESAVSWQNDPPEFTNSILWGSNHMCVPNLDSTGDPDISYSCVQGGYAGEGNISDDPLFRNAAAGDYRLLPESPCIDTAGTSGPDDDLNGKPRPVDIAGIGREVTDTYDMGAYEFQLNELPTPTPTQTPSQVDPGHTGLYQ